MATKIEREYFYAGVCDILVWLQERQIDFSQVEPKDLDALLSFYLDCRVRDEKKEEIINKAKEIAEAWDSNES